MQNTPKSLRLHITLFGRTNVGKSSLLNLLAGQDVSIVSPEPGTTTDMVEKPMELLPIGPIVLLDTAGLDDQTVLSTERLKKTEEAYHRTDVILLVCENNLFDAFERNVIEHAAHAKTPVIAVVNKIDCAPPEPSFLAMLKEQADAVITCTATDPRQRETLLTEFKRALLLACPDDFLQPPPLVGDLLPAGGLAILIIPIDLQAPKGRLILPQVQTLRDALDNDAAALVVKEREYTAALQRLNQPPDLVICDSQVVMKMVADTPSGIPCTTFSILFARLKGDLAKFARGAAAIDRLKSGDRILIAESCSHHAMEDDIGRVKIPRWLRQYTGADLTFESFAGRDFPANLSDYALVVQCGGCMNNRREMLSRIQRCETAGVPITNYGVCISQTQGVLRRVLSPFPSALDAYLNEMQ
ncbi:MAG: [FeFe] hydrogenase H-cluster maturation GTPase HydF [Kiritimatiellae bacterium]|nr:[FeFe] hydrogenase H-cluster maturation GTPase HydF [Kiritimatiellia bacterium]